MGRMCISITLSEAMWGQLAYAFVARLENKLRDFNVKFKVYRTN